ncbi:MAG: hypothetical protein AB3N20_09060 [Rhizobiaceae bacterium]
MATILTFTLAGRRVSNKRPKSGKTGSVIPFPGVRYERLTDKKSLTAGKDGKTAVSANGKARYKPDF